MRRAIKKTGKVQAYQLGQDDNVILCRLIKEGKVNKVSDAEYEIFSQEAVAGYGQFANRGDFIKVDSAGFPYPISKEIFLKNHIHVAGDNYEQKLFPVYVWRYDDGMCPAVQFLIDKKGLVINEEDEKKYFNARLWGTDLSAEKNAYLIFYSIDYDERGEKILDADFNFIEKNEFQLTYDFIE